MGPTQQAEAAIAPPTAAIKPHLEVPSLFSLLIFAIHSIPNHGGNSAELLAKAVGISPYEANARLRFAGQFPVVISVFDDEEVAGILHLV
jgi:hypothetical protein